MQELFTEILKQSIEIKVHRRNNHITIIAYSFSGAFECYAETYEAIPVALAYLLKTINEKAERFDKEDI